MTLPLRVVLDTNVLVSAAIFANSAPRRCFDHVAARCVLVMSKDIRAELAEVLARPKFDRLSSPAKRMAFLKLLPAAVDDVELHDIPKVCRDPDDDMVLATALAGRADVIVSGDADLLDLHPFRGIPVLNPAAFLEWAGAAPP